MSFGVSHRGTRAAGEHYISIFKVVDGRTGRSIIRCARTESPTSSANLSSGATRCLVSLHDLVPPPARPVWYQVRVNRQRRYLSYRWSQPSGGQTRRGQESGNKQD